MATHIKTLIECFLGGKKKDLEKQDQLNKILSKILDKETKKHIWLKTIKKNILFLKSDSSAATYNFNLYKNQILNEVGQVWGKIEDIKVEIS